ncbi:polyisoprenoid-binding protein [Lysobacter pythonis]|uniref:Polyisoprenoid-binding protein n=1 Tax=Solilutibacter pythonis TaxID=2483112 RepID=A0A3M2I4I0_9GAMM|nr:YceI family protein [Lysobacter pythonis]RMH93124.1 polyisoprenoid-binding protein [Lysobacter pythonis]
MKRPLLAGLLAAAALPALAEKIEYAIDPTHTMVIASWSHFGYSNPMANFAGATGTLLFDPADPAASSVRVDIPMEALTSFVPKLDDELRGKDYFDVAKYPVARFVSREVKPLGEDRYEVQGELSLRGISRPVTLDVRLNKRGIHPMLGVRAIGFDATAAFNRSSFGIGKYVPMVGDAVQLRITTEAHAEKK